MPDKPWLHAGDVVQLSPETGDFGGCFMVITEPKSWGAQGYVRVPAGGDAYFRAKTEHMHFIGRAEWVRPGETEDSNA